MNTATELGISLQREAILSQRLMHCLDNGLDLDMVEDDRLWK